MGFLKGKTRILGFAVPTWILALIVVGWVIPIAFFSAPMTLTDPPQMMWNKLTGGLGDLSIGGEFSDDGSAAGRSDLPTISLTLDHVELLQEDTTATPNVARLYDTNWNVIAVDACGDATLTFNNVPQGKNCYIYIKASANGHSIAYKRTTPVVGQNPGTTTHYWGQVAGPIALVTAQAADYVYNGSVSMSGQTYDISNSGTNPIMTLKEVFTPGASVQDRWLGSDYLEPETGKQHSSYVIVRTNSSAVKVIGPGNWQQVSTISYDYFYKKVPPLGVDYKSDGTYSALSWSHDINFECGTVGASTVAEVLIDYEDDVEDEEAARANWGTAYDTTTLYIQD
jgi:hypothetical protein